MDNQELNQESKELITNKKYIYSKEKIKEYNENYKNKHKNEIIKCDVCLKEYTKFNSFYHKKTKLHQTALLIRNELKIL